MSNISTVSKLLLSTGLVTVVSAGTAFAQTAWDGFYGGTSFSSSAGGVFENGGPDFESTNSSAFVGFNHSFGNYVVGAEVETFLGDVATNSFGFAMEGLVDMKVRGGMAYGSALFYVSAGLSSGKMTDVGFADYDTGANGTNYGIGVDYAVSDSLFIGVNYTIREMNDGDSYNIDTSSFSTVSIRAGYKF